VLAQADWQLQRLVRDVAYCTDGEGRERVVGVENLYRRARRTSREAWPELITEFLRTVNTVEPEEHLSAELEAVAGQLLPRIGHPIKLELDEAMVWHQPLAATGLVVNLVIDYRTECVT